MSISPASPEARAPAGRNLQVRYAEADDASFITDLTARVQDALTVSDSLQEIGPLALAVVESSVQGEHAYLLQLNGQRIGSVLVDPLDGIFSNTAKIEYVSWGVQGLCGPFWYLHALVLEPAEQGHRFGLAFLEGVLRFMKMKHQAGTIVLDCWAGNEKLRRFYQEAGFQHHGDFAENDYKISVYVFNL
jgi:GNAT superfamily N-acetyltransferase